MSAMAQAQKKKAEVFVAEAEKLLSKKSWFSSGREKNQEEAAEALLQAANAYKVGGLNQEAGEIYARVGGIYKSQLSNTNEAAKAYTQAASCFKKANPADALQAYQSAISLLTDAGRLTQAAKLSRDCAELYENEEVAVENAVDLAIEMYEQAADLFQMEDSKGQSSNCKAKVAELASAAKNPPDLLKAGQIYDELGRNCLDSNLLKFNAKGYFLQSILCQLANSDSIGAEQALQRYEGVDYTFSESREGRFARSLVECVQGFDAEGFAQACFEFDRVSKLDPWKTSMLVQIKRGIQGETGEGGEEDDFDLT